MDEPAPIEELHLRRILVAIDGSPSAELALRAAMTAAHVDRAAITMLVVVPHVRANPALWSLAGAHVDTEELQGKIDEEAAQLLRRTIARLPPDLPVTTRIRRGKAGPEICAEASECGVYDTILLGARGLGRVGAAVGSVSSYVMHHAETAVVVVRPPGKAESAGREGE